MLKSFRLPIFLLATAIALAQPAPTPGIAGPAFAYQQLFDTDYYASQPPAKQPLYNGRAWAQNANLPQLSQPAINALTVQLLAQGFIIDEQIDFLGLDPYALMYVRQAYGNTWVPAGLGLAYTNVEPPSIYTGPVPAGQIKVSTLLSDYPPYPTPAVFAAPPPIPQSANPVGIRIIAQVPAAPNFVGDQFRCAIANDGFALGDTWSGTSGTFTGMWLKQALEAGLMTVWTKTQ
jgi:hypothetical protein